MQGSSPEVSSGPPQSREEEDAFDNEMKDARRTGLLAVLGHEPGLGTRGLSLK